jgi:hypothetical protein
MRHLPVGSRRGTPPGDGLRARPSALKIERPPYSAQTSNGEIHAPGQVRY